METDDLIVDVPPAPPKAVSVPQLAGLSPLVAMLGPQVADLKVRVAKLEERAKSPRTVLEDLELVLPRMTPDELGELSTLVDQTVARLLKLGRRVNQLRSDDTDN